MKDDDRFNTYGIPRNVSKSTKKASDKKETVPNANYLWISYFATALNDTGKAALVMANSASDAGKSEYDIRKKMIEKGIISQMVTLPSNMFSSVTLPATLWFFDKAKAHTAKRDEILFVDARNVFTQIDRAHRKFSDEQIKNLGVITRLYNGENEEFYSLLQSYKTEVLSNLSILLENLSELMKYEFYFDGDGKETYKEPQLRSCAPKFIKMDSDLLRELSVDNVTAFKKAVQEQNDELTFASIGLHFEQYYSKKQDKKIKEYDLLMENSKKAIDTIIYFLNNILWLVERFPDGVYCDVIGLCKVAKLDGEDSIVDQDYSLNPGRYVGVVIEDDGLTAEEFKAEMLALNGELATLNDEAHELETAITNNLIKLLEG